MDRGMVHDGIVQVLLGLGLDLNDPNFKGTPARVVRAYQEIFVGLEGNVDYQVDQILSSTFPCEHQQMVVARNIEVFSMCVVGSTFVETPRGRIPIQYLKDGDWIYTIDPQTFEILLTRCQNPRITQRGAELVRVYSDNDSILCTPDHKFLLTNGKWVEAGMLNGGDRVTSLYRTYQNHSYPVLQSVTPGTHSRKLSNGVVLLGESRAIAEHEFVYWSALGYEGRIRIGKKEVIHHVDEITWNNDPENLERITVSDHNKSHRKLMDIPDEERIRRNLLARKNSHSPEASTKRRASIKAGWDRIKSDPTLYAERTKNMGRQYDDRKPTLNHVILGVERVSWREDVWCMTVPETETFFANGMAVHNCPHHLLPVRYLITVGYLPGRGSNAKVLGISKLARIVELFAARPALQEQMVNDVTGALMKIPGCDGAGCIAHGEHMCMRMRGVRQSQSIVITNSLRGGFLDDEQMRDEFMALIR